MATTLEMATYLDCLNLKGNAEGETVLHSFRFINDWMSLPVFLRKPIPCAIFKKNLSRFLMDKHFLIMGQCVVLKSFRSVTFLFLILDFNSFYFLWRTALKTMYLCDGRFLLKDCLLLLLLLLLLLQVKPEITIYNYISHKKVDIRQRNK